MMNTPRALRHSPPAPTTPLLQRLLPFLGWMSRYRREDAPRDLVAGLVTAVMLIPQSMAYAQLAGLPPQIGLYASVGPLAIYALLGTSRQLSVGPVAITSLLVAAGIGPLAQGDAGRYLALTLLLALMVGTCKLLLGVFRLGALLNFISHPVLAAFTTASALLIAVGQVKYLLGYRVRGDHFFDTLGNLLAGIGQTNLVTLGIGLVSLAMLIFFRTTLRGLLQRTRLPALAITLLVSSAPLLTVTLGILLTAWLRLDTSAGVAVVGAIPGGIAPFRFPVVTLTDVQLLLPTATTIVLVSVVESIAVARVLARKRREPIDPNQELIALGMANIAAGLGSGYPVTGGFARSVVNFQAGAVTGLASLITAGAIAVILLVATPLFYFLPQAVLAATVVVAVFGLVDVGELRHLWHRDRADALTWLLTCAAVLLFGVETGIFAGVALSLGLYLWRTSRPHIAVVGRVGESELYRNVLRHDVRVDPQIIAMRVDESLYFANTPFLEQQVLLTVDALPATRHVVLIGTGINAIDSSAMGMLESLYTDLRARQVSLHFAAIKGPVMDHLRAAGFVEQLGSEHFFPSTHDAMQALTAPSR